jgi:hypothetical protein
MKSPLSHPLDRVRTDGWFERVGQSVPSFRALCEILGERFFAFSLIAGARISALTVDRRRPENTLVEFTVGAEEGGTTEQVPLREFQARLVSALLLPAPPGPPPARDDDIEGIQQFIGPQFLLLAPLYGYRLVALLRNSLTDTEISFLADDQEYSLPLEEFREILRERVRAELDHAAEAAEGASLDLSNVAQAETLYQAGDDSAPHSRRAYTAAGNPRGACPSLEPSGRLLRCPARHLTSRRGVSPRRAVRGRGCERGSSV